MKRFVHPLLKRLHRLTNRKPSATVVLFFGAMLAMLRVNSPFANQYFSFLNAELIFQIGGVNLFSFGAEPFTIAMLVNDGLMTIFFFLVGLEIKQEILAGSLSSWRKSLLPVVGALGGMLVPVLCFLLILPSGPESVGAAIPMATDIAFSLAVLSLLGAKVSPSLRTFLLALAVVDDIGGIIVIAVFYAGTISWRCLAIAALLLLALAAYNYLSKTKYLWATAVIGVIVRGLFMKSGIHPTIAGVLLAFTIFALPKYQLSTFLKKIKKLTHKIIPKPLQLNTQAEVLTKEQLDQLETIEHQTIEAISPLQHIEHELTPMVEYLILPLFAFVNMGITFDFIAPSEFFGIPFAIILGLVVGKPLGIFLFTYLAQKLQLVRFPEGITTKTLFGISLFGGIGFTVSLFIAGLSYAQSSPEFLNQAKVGVLLGSVIAGFIAYESGKKLFQEKG